MKYIFTALLLFTISVVAAEEEREWPFELEGPDWTLNIYQPINESFEGNILKSRCAVSLVFDGKEEPIFGAMWVESKLTTDRDTRKAILESIRVTGLKFPESVDTATVSRCKQVIEYEVPKVAMPISIDRLLSTLEYAEEENIASESIKNDPPEIIISKKPAILIVIDGDPKFENMEGHPYERIANTPFFMIRDPKSKNFYLYSSSNWFTSTDIHGSWAIMTKLNSDLKKLDKDLKASTEEASADTTGIIPEIYVRTKPAELLSMNGDPEFVPVEGTSLLYVKNTTDNIFRTVESQEYFILVSGRWFRSASMKGPWSYIRADELPAEFSKIPEGSAKDNVLSSVAGTDAAKEALLDAQIPQTAAVNRDTATTQVKYDGDPKFKKVEETSLYYAINTSSTVLRTNDNVYYVCDNGVWFTGMTPNGPWEVATVVPAEVQKIPASSPVYNVKYVYIYETTPSTVYVGYTPGYMGCYHYGPTVVYGTGYHYHGWYGTYYYPRPVTYGFNFHYNPYTGWSMGFSMSFGGPHGWMTFGYGSPYYYGGWWGPPVYRPPYYHRPPYGYYGHRSVHYHNTNININRNNNIYANRPGNGISSGNRPVNRPSEGRPAAGKPSTRPSEGRPSTGRPSTRPSEGRPSTGQQPSTRPSTGRPSTGQQPATKPPTGRPSTGQQPAGRPSTGQQPSTRPSTGHNNVYTDRSGNVYRNNGNNWERNNGSSWQPTQSGRPANQQQLNNMQYNRNRGNTRHNNSTQYSRPQNYSRPQQSRPQPSQMPRGGGRRR